MAFKRSALQHPEISWAIIACLVLVLAMCDRVPHSQLSSVDQALDAITIVVSMIGSIWGWVVSYRAPLQAQSAPKALIIVRIVLSWLFGPLLVVGAALAAKDIDGGLLLFYVPILGTLLTLTCLPFLLATRSRRLS